MRVARIGKNAVKLGRSTSFPRNTPTSADWCNVGQVTMNMPPDIALLEFFDFYVTAAEASDSYNRESWTCVSKMARHRLWVTTSSKSATSRHTREICESNAANAGYLATLAH